MNAAREVRARLNDARAFCIALGLVLAPRASARQAFVLCPWHEERSPSCSVRVAKDGSLSVRCHACGATGDALSLIQRVRGVGFRDALSIAAELANAPGLAVEVEERSRTHVRDDVDPLGDETYDRVWTHILAACSPMRAVSPAVAAYLAWRGIGADAEAAGLAGLPRDGRALVRGLLATFDRRDLELAGVLRRGFDALDWPAWAVLIPWRNRWGRITCMQRRRLDDGAPKYRSPFGRSPRAPFGVETLGERLEALGADAEVIFTEGALDALARRRIAREKGECAAILGVYSAASPAAGLPVDLLEGRRVVLALDADEAGERACGTLADVLRGIAGELVRERPEGAKDWLEALSGAQEDDR